MADPAAPVRLMFHHGARPQASEDDAEGYFAMLARIDLRAQGLTLEDLTEHEQAVYHERKTAYVGASTGMGCQPEHEHDAAQSAKLRRTLAHPEGRRRYHEAIADLRRSLNLEHPADRTAVGCPCSRSTRRATPTPAS